MQHTFHCENAMQLTFLCENEQHSQFVHQVVHVWYGGFSCTRNKFANVNFSLYWRKLW